MSNLLDDHAQAVLGLLRANPQLADTTHDGAVPKPRPQPPYVVIYLHMERPRAANGNALDGVSAELTLRAICHCVGSDATAARAMAYQVGTALLDVTPAVGGRECSQISQESSTPPARDETTGGLVMDQIDVYRMTSTPAT